MPNETMPESPSEEQPLQQQRALSDAELIKGGARYAIGDGVDPRLEVTKEQVEDAQYEMHQEAENRKTIEQLTGPEFMYEFKQIEEIVQAHKRDFYDFQRYQSTKKALELSIAEAVVKEGLDDIVLSEILEKLKINEENNLARQAQSAHLVVRFTNDFAKKFGLDLEITGETRPDKIISEVKKAYHAKLFELGADRNRAYI